VISDSLTTNQAHPKLHTWSCLLNAASVTQKPHGTTALT